MSCISALQVVHPFTSHATGAVQRCLAGHVHAGPAVEWLCDCAVASSQLSWHHVTDCNH